MPFKQIYSNLDNNNLFLLVACSFVVSCASVPKKYNVTPMVKQTHNQVMTLDFPDKKSVFFKFGTPTIKDSLDNIENWYYKIAEVTNTTSLSHSTGMGIIKQNPYHPSLPVLNRSLITTETTLSRVNTNSTTIETYVRFWFKNDSVIKWETYGVNYEREIPNKYYDHKIAKETETKRMEAIKKNKPIVFGSFIATFLVFVTIPFLF